MGFLYSFLSFIFIFVCLCICVCVFVMCLVLCLVDPCGLITYKMMMMMIVRVVVWRTRMGGRAAYCACLLHESCFHQSSFRWSSSSAVWSAVYDIIGATSVIVQRARASRRPARRPDTPPLVRHIRLTYCSLVLQLSCSPFIGFSVFVTCSRSVDSGELYINNHYRSNPV